MRPQAVLFDIGNVVVRWSPANLYSKIFADPDERERFLSSVCTMAWHIEVDRGATFTDNIRRLTARHPEYADEIAAWWDRWPEMFSGTIAETEAAIEALDARGIPLFGLTNMSREAWPGVRAMSPVFALFQDTVISAEEGVIKPDAEIFRIALRRAGLPPEALLFIDDSEANILAARDLGFHVHHFTDPAALAPALKVFGLL